MAGGRDHGHRGHEATGHEVQYILSESAERGERRKAYPLRCPMFAYVVMSAALLLGRMSAGHFLQRQRKVTICALVQSASGLNVVLVVPLVMSSLTAHRTAPA